MPMGSVALSRRRQEDAERSGGVEEALCHALKLI